MEGRTAAGREEASVPGKGTDGRAAESAPAVEDVAVGAPVPGPAAVPDAAARERALRAELQAAERRAAFLAEASSILAASSLNVGATMRSLARLAVSRLGDWCIIQVLSEHGELLRSEVAHRDPRRESALVRVAATLEPAEWIGAARMVLESGQPELLERLSRGLWEALEPQERSELLERGNPARVVVAPLLGRGRLLGATLLVAEETTLAYDADDLELVAELARRAAIALDNARLYHEAQEANRAKADFLAVISHELRTPLNSIMGYSDLLDTEVSGALSAKQHTQVGRIRASARHLLQLIDEILSYARMETGGDEVRITVTEAGALAESAAAAIEPLAHASGLAFEVEVRDRRVPLETDSTKVRQVLVNLLSNAVKFTERGTVGVRFYRDGEHGVYEVWDTGVGIPADQHQRIFDPFWQIDPPNTRRAGGTGLGLSVSRRFARLLDGELSLESEPGVGSTFRLRIPLNYRRSSSAMGAD